MNENELEHAKEELLRLKSELEELKETFMETGETVELDQAKVGRLSRMDAIQGQQMALETARRAERQLTKTDGALLRINSGDYGCCFICGEEIDARRLAADPTSTRCVLCTEKQDTDE